MTAFPTLSRRDAIPIANAILSLSKKIAETVREWQCRARSRGDLMALSERELWDVGLTRVDAEREANKPFWRE
jgi:uncharacterized protein YjiS (DUF1127 family)